MKKQKQITISWSSLLVLDQIIRIFPEFLKQKTAFVSSFVDRSLTVNCLVEGSIAVTSCLVKTSMLFFVFNISGVRSISESRSVITRVITDRDSLIERTPEILKTKNNIDVFTKHEVTAIDPSTKQLTVKDLSTNEETKAVFCFKNSGNIRIIWSSTRRDDQLIVICFCFFICG